MRYMACFRKSLTNVLRYRTFGFTCIGTYIGWLLEHSTSKIADHPYNFQGLDVCNKSYLVFYDLARRTDICYLATLFVIANNLGSN